ncbi:Lactonase, 7-bladed beta-propeller-domain-containing protein [Phlebopus sp. FC_14]|nr:Lactonase, 7-bladed beta-propeller-domain-containing protein [Phlebopus sp. FC_14]
MTPRKIFVGSYTHSIYTLEFDPDQSPPSLKLLAETTVGYHPSWIAFHPSDTSLIFTGLEQTDGEIALVKYAADGQGKVVARAKSGGGDPCTLLVDEDEVIIGNYSSGTLATLPISTAPPYILSPQPWTLSMPFEMSGPNKSRQTSSHPHQTIFNTLNKTSKELLVPDLGTDKVWRLTKAGDKRWAIQSYLQYELGSGPRHVATYGKSLYTLLELTSTLAVHDLSSLSHSRTPLGTRSTLTSPPPPPHDMLAAEILIPTPNLPFPDPYIYTSNRNDPSPEGDSIAIFSLVAGEDKPELVGEVRTGLKHVRGMLFGCEDDRWLVVGGVEGGGVKVFERVDGGKDLKEVAMLGINKPTGFLWG